MTPARLPAVFAGVALTLCLAAGDAGAAAFNVYYKPAAGGKWTFYAGKADRAAADATAKDLKDVGFQAEVLADGTAPPRPARPAGRSQGVVVRGATFAPAYVGGFRVGFGPGSRVGTATVHHYRHVHAAAKASAKATAKAGHPRRPAAHPTRGAHALHRQHQRAKPPSFSHHHAQHHTHTHAHHHAHGGKKH